MVKLMARLKSTDFLACIIIGQTPQCALGLHIMYHQRVDTHWSALSARSCLFIYRPIYISMSQKEVISTMWRTWWDKRQHRIYFVKNRLKYSVLISQSWCYWPYKFHISIMLNTNVLTQTLYNRIRWSNWKLPSLYIAFINHYQKRSDLGVMW